MIENKSIRLRPITKDDTNNILKWRNSPEVKKYFCMQEDLTEKQHHAWLENKVATGEVIQYIIYSKQLKKDVGSVYIRNIESQDSNGEFGIFIGEIENRGHGIGTQAMKLICDYAFEVLDLHKIYLRVLTTNQNAIATYKRNGFEEEGLFKDHVYNPQQGFLDLLFMAKINPNHIEKQDQVIKKIKK